MMKTFGKTRLSLAVGAALMASTAAAVNVTTDGIGEVAISPYYTVRDGWQTLINLTNTADVPVVVKVRIHEQWNSRDVFDFNIAMSAFDVWTGAIQEGGNGAILHVTDDDTCTIPNNIDGLPLSALGYSGLDDRGQSNDDLGPQHIDRMREGYIEFIVMGHADRNSYDDGASQAAKLLNIGGAIEHHDCPTVELAFNNDNIATTARQFGEPINALKFNYRLLNPLIGVEAGGAATAWANFYNPLPPYWDGLVTPALNAACTLNRGAERDAASPTDGAGPDWNPAGGGGSCMNLITAQTPYGFLEPSLNDVYPTVGNWYDDFLNTPVAVPSPNPTVLAQAPGFRGIDALSGTIQRARVINEWSSNPTLGVAADWVVTWPTKGFYVDQGTGRQFAIVPGDRDEAGIDDGAGSALPVPYPPFAEAFTSPGTSDADRELAGSCNQVSFERYDRAENTLTREGDVVPSPAPSLPVDELCYEANVLTFNDGNALGSPNSVNVDTTGLAPNTNGWMRLRLDVDTAAVGGAVNPNGNGLPGGLANWTGLPTIGFMVKTRNYGDVTRNNASSMDHGYERLCGNTSICGRIQ